MACSCFAWSRREGLADRLAQMKVMNLPKNYLETYTTKINSVEPDQIEAAAKKYMATDNDAIVVVGDASAIQKSLEKFGNVSVVKPEVPKPNNENHHNRRKSIAAACFGSRKTRPSTKPAGR